MPHAEGVAGLAVATGHSEVVPALALNIRQQRFVFSIFRLRITEFAGHFIKEHRIIIRFKQRKGALPSVFAV